MIFSKKTKWKALAGTHENLAKIGISDARSVPNKAKKLLKKLRVPVQKNSTVATALMLTISPEYLRDGDLENKINDEKLDKFVEGSLKFLRKKYGNRLLLACLHMDEMNPHLSAYILPLIRKEMKKSGRPINGEEKSPRPIRIETRLGHTAMFTRDYLVYELDEKTNDKILTKVIPGTCSKLQDEYSIALQDEGLDVQRGVKAEPGQPKLKYTTAKQQYQRILRGIENTDEILESVKTLNPHQIEELLRQSVAVATESDNYRKQRDHYQRIAGENQQKISALEKTIADSMRELSVAEVIQAVTGIHPVENKSLGNPIVRQGSSKTKKISIDAEFHLPGGQKIGVDYTQNCFENLTPFIPFLGEGAKRQSGVGSINAVMYLTGNSYGAALARLASIFGNEPVKRAVLKKTDMELEDQKKALTLPDESKWPELFAKMQAMNIDNEVIENAKKTSLIAANSEGQLIFTKKQLDEAGTQTNSGITVVDPQFPAVNVLETGGDDMFFMIEPNAKHTVICATPIDVLAIKSRREHRSANVISVGMNPGETTNKTLQLFAGIYPTGMFFAENLLAHGRKVADWLEEQFSEVVKKLPLPNNLRSWIGNHISRPNGGSEVETFTAQKKEMNDRGDQTMNNPP